MPAACASARTSRRCASTARRAGRSPAPCALPRRSMPAPVLLLSALGTVDDRVEGLRAGGDDYLVKPFAFAELLARVEALLRRAAGDGQQLGVLRVADLEINVMARRVTRAGRAIDLTAKEFQLVDFLVSC